MSFLLTALLLIILLSQSYIDLELAAGSLNAPLADWGAVLLLPVALIAWLRGDRSPLPGLAGYGLMLIAAWRLLGRRDLDQEGDAPPPRHARRRPDA